MKLFKKHTFSKSIVCAFALGTILNASAMEEQEYGNENTLTSFVETLDAAHKANNLQLCGEIFRNFAEDLAQKDPIEQVAAIVNVTKTAAEKNEHLTLVFCTNLISICNNNPNLSEITQDITSELIPTFQRYSRLEALEKLAVIFSDKPESEEYQSIKRSIEAKLGSDPASQHDNDEVIARAMQDNNFHPDTNNDEDDTAFAQALNESLNAHNHNNDDTAFQEAVKASLADSHQFSAPSFEEITELEEEDNLSIAIEKSLQTAAQPTPVNKKPSFWQDIFDILIGGFGS